ncbi:HAMP domain-containing histidine kinase [Hymenobacter setariae]|uniref:histidine kinase n=1 Tax=Hymenobacter setariae TaxID=2594794 RepID=A0A558C3D9_9BACT|nr:HAMP domain-containing sensor histidine kinase [Hymenobacter setariae]TVT43288.1 HAMP domain-containing histidine kinase [Hymenobacter setariae]
MQHRIRLITWLLAACVLGINGFQAYWLYSTYKLTTAQLDRAAHQALVAAVQQQLIAGVEALRAPGVKLVLSGTSSTRVGVRREVTAAKVTVVPKGASRAIAAPAGQYAHIVIDDWSRGERLKLAALTHAYRWKLHQYGVDSAAVLDTFSIRGTDAAPRPAPALRSQLARFPRPTPPVLLSPKKEMYVRAHLPPPTHYLWQRLGGLLGGSVLLLLLTSGCFGLVRHTLVAQRKLAEAKNDFINNMTHELKTPLTTVSAAVETLERFGLQADPEKVRTYFRISHTELRRLSDLVDKVLSIASKEQQALVLHPEPVHPAELVQAAVHRHQLQGSKHVHFEVDVAPADVVQADRLHLDGVINNLIDNAIKYSKGHVTIALRSSRTASGWQLTVQDNGIGIASGYQAAVFDRFFRVPTGNLHTVKGFGLGLYYVRQVVERHGGRIAVRSESGRGSTFTLWLPHA